MKNKNLVYKNIKKCDKFILPLMSMDLFMWYGGMKVSRKWLLSKCRWNNL